VDGLPLGERADGCQPAPQEPDYFSASQRIHPSSFIVHCGIESAWGRVSRARLVHTTARNCAGDEGGPFGVGNHGLISSHCKLLWSKAMVVSVAAKSGQHARIGTTGRGERKRTVDEVSKAD
jgi:hypothetical protein